MRWPGARRSAPRRPRLPCRRPAAVPAAAAGAPGGGPLGSGLRLAGPAADERRRRLQHPFHPRPPSQPEGSPSCQSFPSPSPSTAFCRSPELRHTEPEPAPSSAPHRARGHCRGGRADPGARVAAPRRPDRAKLARPELQRAQARLSDAAQAHEAGVNAEVQERVGALESQFQAAAAKRMELERAQQHAVAQIAELEGRLAQTDGEPQELDGELERLRTAAGGREAALETRRPRSRPSWRGFARAATKIRAPSCGELAEQRGAAEARAGQALRESTWRSCASSSQTRLQWPRRTKEGGSESARAAQRRGRARRVARAGGRPGRGCREGLRSERRAAGADRRARRRARARRLAGARSRVAPRPAP